MTKIQHINQPSIIYQFYFQSIPSSMVKQSLTHSASVERRILARSWNRFVHLDSALPLSFLHSVILYFLITLECIISTQALG